MLNANEIFGDSVTTETQSSVVLMEQFIRRYVALPDLAYFVLAVWCVATYLAQTFDCFPYLALTSPVKRCGKSRCLEVMELLCARSWHGTAPTAPSLYRMMANCPTLLLDEVESLKTAKNASETQQAILAVLNAGHRGGATVPRCAGKDQHLELFPVYGPKAFACIGGLPDTLSDRSIVIMMQRRTKEQPVERFLFRRAKEQAAPICATVTEWAAANDEKVRTAYESITDLDFLTDRDADLWMPLFGLCSVIAPERLPDLKKCAVSQSGKKQDDDADDSLPLAYWPT